MPTKRTRVSRQQRTRITPEAVEAFRAGDVVELHRALGLSPWEASPLDVDADDADDRTAWAASLEQARELRDELTKAKRRE